ncbi:MAG TPA: transposase [Nitrospirota bacterium]|nr:transposase [Nitrospirota bacterium]
MARPLRIEYSGAFYHVMHRGNAGSDLFKSERDRGKLLEYFSKAVARYEIKIHTYCLMTNHYHLLIETPHANLSQAIKWINVSYAAYFNRKRRRSGHLFQGRFKAVLVDADEYLKHLSRYIHLNPVRAGMVEHCKDYAWSSYPVFSGYNKLPEWLETHWLLSLFGKNQDQAKKRYRDFVESVQNQEIENPSKDIVSGVILGGVDFVNWVKQEFLSKRSDIKEIPQLRSLKPRLTPEDLISVVCEEFDCGRETILRKGKKKNLARDLAIYLSREVTGESGVALGRYFGGISGAGILVRHNHIANRIETDRRLKRRVNRIRKKIINN